MRKPTPDFANKKATNAFYDIREDWDLIVSSFAKQYGIRLRNERDMPFSEFISLLSGLMPDTPLGQIVAIRSEKDPKVIKKFTLDQRRIHREWKVRMAKTKLNDIDDYNRSINNVANALRAMFSKKGGG